MVCTLSFGEISNIHDGLHIRLASALLSLCLETEYDMNINCYVTKLLQAFMSRLTTRIHLLIYIKLQCPFVRTPLETQPIRTKLPASLAGHTTSDIPKKNST